MSQRKTDLTQQQVGNKNKIHQVPRGKLLGKGSANCALNNPDVHDGVRYTLNNYLHKISQVVLVASTI